MAPAISTVSMPLSPLIRSNTEFADSSGAIEDFDIPGGVTTAQDSEERWVVFFSDQWAINYFERRNPNAEQSEIPWDEVEKTAAK